MTTDDEQLVRDRLGELRNIATPTDEIWSTISGRASKPQLASEPFEHHRGRWLAAAAVLLMLAGSAAALSTRDGSDPEPLRTANGKAATSTTAVAATGELTGTVEVTQQAGGPVRICSSPLFTSGSECSGPEVTGWTWEAVGGGTAGPGGERTGSYTITGHFEGDRFVLTSASLPEHGSDLEAAIPAPCTARATDLTTNNQGAFDAMLATASSLPGYAGEWFSRDPGAPTSPFDPAAGTETVAVAGDAEATRSQLEAIWGGRLCVVAIRSSLSELMSVQERLDAFAQANSIDMTGISIDPVANVVQVGVLVASDQAQAAADAEFGPGLVSIVGRLAPS
jgi:hypothetical protein